MDLSFGNKKEDAAWREGSIPQFKTPEEEIAYLRARVARKEEALGGAPEGAPHPERERVIREELNKYKNAPHEAVAPDYRLKADQIEREVLHISGAHEEKIDQLIEVMHEKGLKNALVIVEKMGASHIEDDFHRFLVQYLAAGMTIPGLEAGGRILKALQMKLYEVTLPQAGEESKERTFAELVSRMEQFYSGMLSLSYGTQKDIAANVFTLEIAQSNYSEEVIFYASVPASKGDLFEKHMRAIYPDVSLREHKEDYNPFSDGGVTIAGSAKFVHEDILPIKTYDTFQHDPLQVLLSAFAKMKHEGEGAAVQFVFSPRPEAHMYEYRRALERLRKGQKLSTALRSEVMDVAHEFKDVAKSMFWGGKTEKQHAESKEKKDEAKEINQKLVEAVERKLGTPIIDTNIRVVASAGDEARAHAIASEVESAFQQFSDPLGNGITFTNTEGAQKTKLLRDFIFRAHTEGDNMELSLKELTTLFHFPVTRLDAPQLKQAASGKSAPAPVDVAQEGVTLGINRYQGHETTVHMTREDRMRHFYVIGQTGTGKTTILKNMIVQDIKNGDGVCFIDPHGNDIDDILANIPRERLDDVIYFDPASTARPMGLNMLEYDERFPEQKIFVVNELLAIFNKLFDMKTAGGPAFEQYFRNSALLVMDDPRSGNTLLEIGRVLSDKAFRDLKLSRCKNPIIKQFWDNAEKTTGDQGLANYVPYVTNKFDVFISNDIMRPIIAQERSAFNFRDIMDSKKIFLVNLSKGRLGDINSSLIGLILVGKILMAALSRVDAISRGEKPADFYLYIDEFQNVTTDSIATILSEARKYRLSLNVAHQYIKQLEEGIKNAVFGNVGSMAVFRVGTEDAEFLQEQFKPVFTAQDIIKVENWNAYIKMLVNGVPSRPFNIATLPPPQGNRAIVEKIKELSALTYGRPREEVEAEVMRRYR